MKAKLMDFFDVRWKDKIRKEIQCKAIRIGCKILFRQLLGSLVPVYLIVYLFREWFMMSTIARLSFY